MNKTAILSAIFLQYSAVMAVDITGVVRDSVSRDPVAGARVALLQDTSIAAITNGQGAFHFIYPTARMVPVPSAPHDLLARNTMVLCDVRGLMVSRLAAHNELRSGIIIAIRKAASAHGCMRIVFMDRGELPAGVAAAMPARFAKSLAIPALRISKTGFAAKQYTPAAETMTGLTLGLLPDGSELLNRIDTVIADMTAAAHEGQPHGIVADWSVHPRWGSGISPRTDWFAFTHWGQIYEALEGNPSVNYRVNIRNLQAYILYKSDNLWRQIQSTTAADGAAYREDFANDQNIPAVKRPEADGSISVTVGNGYNFHFWPTSGRATIDPANIAGVFTTFQARLIPNDFSQADNRDAAHVVASAGGDYWRSLTAQWASDWSNNGDYAIGRFKYVRKQWRCFNAWAGDSTYIKAHPPQLD